MPFFRKTARKDIGIYISVQDRCFREERHWNSRFCSRSMLSWGKTSEFSFRFKIDVFAEKDIELFIFDRLRCILSARYCRIYIAIVHYFIFRCLSFEKRPKKTSEFTFLLKIDAFMRKDIGIIVFGPVRCLCQELHRSYLFYTIS